MSTITMTPALHHLLHHLYRAQQHLNTMWNLIPAEIRAYYDTIMPRSPRAPDSPDPDHNRALGNYIFVLSQPPDHTPQPPPTTPPRSTSPTPTEPCPAAAFFDQHETWENSPITREVIQLFETPPTLMAAKPKASTFIQDGTGQLRFASKTSPDIHELPDDEDQPEAAVQDALMRDWKLQDDQLLVQIKQDKRSRPNWAAVAKRLGREVDDCKERWAKLKQHNLDALQAEFPPDLLQEELDLHEPGASSTSTSAATGPPAKRSRHEWMLVSLRCTWVSLTGSIHSQQFWPAENHFAEFLLVVSEFRQTVS